MTGAVITGVRTRALRLPLRVPWGPGIDANHVTVVEVTTSDGLSGSGFCWTPTIGASAARALVDDDIARFVVGRSAEPPGLWDQLWDHLRAAGSGGITTIAMAGLDIALWDRAARQAGLPFVEFLGRRRAEAPSYGSGINYYFALDELLEQVDRFIHAGHRAVKLKVGHADLKVDLARVGAVRDLMGPDRLLMLDANQRWDLPTARHAIRTLERFDIAWVEEPLCADDVWAHQQLHSSIDTPIALGESLFSTYQFREFIQADAVDIVQPNIVRVGGITPFQRIADVARAGGLRVSAHLLPELSCQLALTAPDPIWVEDIEFGSFESLGALVRPAGVVIRNGVALADTGVGLGLEFVNSLSDSDAARPAPSDVG